MKMLKKLFALVLALSMIAGFEVPVMTASAAQTGVVISVGSAAGCDYSTINGALDAIKSGKYKMPSNEAERIYINVDPGEYEEQVIFDNMKYITLRQTPNTDGEVLLTWYYCTGYCYSNCDLNGNYDPSIDWSNPGTWYGYNDVDENGNVITNNEEDFTPYKLGQTLRKLTFEDGTVIGSDISAISYYDKNGAAHRNVNTRVANLGSFDVMATLCVQNNCTDITVEDLRILNSVTVTVTAGEKEGNITPQERYNYDKTLKKVVSSATPPRKNLTICNESTPEIKVDLSKGIDSVDMNKTYSAGESAYLVRSYYYNERGHAISINGDRSILKNVTARGNQDSVYISSGRIYFKDCNLIGGTDYIYGNAAAVFDNCLLGAAGMSDRDYGATITAANTDASNPYGYLFYNCELYNVRSNIGQSVYGRPWKQEAQITFYNTLIDDNKTTGQSSAGINNSSGHGGWSDMNSSKKEEARFYEYGTKMRSGADAGLSGRIKNTNGFGSVLDEWQILEFNPRNYFKARGNWSENWDPMNFEKQYLTQVDAEIAAADINVPAGEGTSVELPTPKDSNIEFKWVSASSNAVVSEDGSKITVTRPAYGEEPITTMVTLYAKDKTTGFGDKKDITVTIAATTDRQNVFNIPVSIKASTNAVADNDYTVTVAKNGALIKQQIVTVPAGQTTATAAIENVPASADGISYDVTIVSQSDEFSIVSPEDGKTSVTGVSGKDVPLNITVQKAVDEKVDTGILYKSGSTSYKAYNLIDLAKSKGADLSIETSDIITVEYDLDVKSAISGSDYIDLLSTKPASQCNTNAFPSRFNLFRMYGNWNQLDMADCTQGFDGTQNTEHQWLNIAGKFDYKTISHVVTTINYKTKTISASVTGSGEWQSIKEYTFAAFPQTYQKGNLYLAVYPSNASNDYTISNVKLTYKKVVSDGGDVEPTESPSPDPIERPTPTPSPTVTPESKVIDFTAMTSVPVYSPEKGQGFVEKSNAIMPSGYERKVAPASAISLSENGASVTESSGSYLVSSEASSDGYNYGGLIYRIDTEPGAYNIEVEITGTSTNTRVAPTGMEAGRLTSTSAWDTAGLVNRETSAKWEGSKWSYNFATGEDFIEIEIEPTTFPTSSAPQTVGVKSIKITPIGINQAGDKPTIHILGDSTQKTYTFISSISAWGQTLVNFFNTDKVNVVNYSMGGRSMKANYTEGRTDDVLMRGKAGDYVFIHSAHNDESDGNTRFVRGTNYSTPAKNNELYNEWLDMYVKAIKARGMIPVLVTAMPRTGNGRYNESPEKPNGFNPDSPGNMRAKAASDSSVGFVELYEGAKKYIDSLDADEISGIYNSIEAGETPADGCANGNTGDGTHYKEAAAKQWSRIMCQNIYDQSVASTDTYKDKPIMQALVSYMKDDVKNAAATGDWSAVFPEMADDVSAVGIKPGAQKQAKENYYYRNSIEKVLQLGIMKKDDSNKFYPSETITVGEFARGIERAFGLAENSLTSYNKTYAELVGTDPTKARITSAKIDNGSTIVELSEIGSGVVIAKKYNKNGILEDVRTADVTGPTVRLSGIEADVVYVWDSLSSMQPVCEPYEIVDTVNISAAEVKQTAEEIYAEPVMETSANGQCSVTVTQPAEGGTVTIYNESNYHTATADVKKNITAGAQFASSDYYTISAPAEVKSGSDSGGKFPDNSAVSTEYVEANSSGRRFVYEAKASGTLTVYVRCRGDRAITCENKTDGTSVQTYIDGSQLPGEYVNAYNALPFAVEAGKTYEIYGAGTSARIFGFNYASEYENSTSALAVNSGDRIRVTAKADTYWLNDSIIVNGTKVSGDKEYTFTVTGDAAVTATFIENPEPKLVETTIIASDAALTREAMGAILYDAYLMRFGKAEDGTWNKPSYMTAHNGTIYPPDHPNYDPNIIQTGATTYYPLTGWAALTDTDDFDDSLYAKTKEVYNLGLIRTESGIARGSVVNGTKIEPKVAVTRAKAAKTLAFAYILTQPENAESQTLPNGNLAANTANIAIPNPNAPSTPWTEEK